jgi:hypothetical protein
LFSFAKSLSAAVKHSPWQEYAGDIVATSGFAFRMWVSADLCPSATSIWSFDDQARWVRSGGLTCDYVGRYWGQDDIAEQKRLEAVANIKASIDNGVPAVSWDIGVPEWGLILGYDDDTQNFATLAINAGSADPSSPAYNPALMPYASLGAREIPLLSVLTVTGASGKPQADILRDTLKLAAAHLNGAEWCDNAKGLEAYPSLIKHFEGDFNPDISWNMEYFLGTYGALKYYAWKYFEKAGERELADIYKEVYDAWMEAFKIKTGGDISGSEPREKIAALLNASWDSEKRAVEVMYRRLAG